MLSEIVGKLRVYKYLRIEKGNPMHITSELVKKLNKAVGEVRQEPVIEQLDEARMGVVEKKVYDKYAIKMASENDERRFPRRKAHLESPVFKAGKDKYKFVAYKKGSNPLLVTFLALEDGFVMFNIGGNTEETFKKLKPSKYVEILKFYEKELAKFNKSLKTVETS